MNLLKSQKPIIGVIHLDYLPGQKGFKGFDMLVSKALADLFALEKGGVDMIMIENWKDETEEAFISEESANSIKEIAGIIIKNTKLPVGINVLPNDYRTAFSLAKSLNLKFIQLDVFVDKVKTNYSYSQAEPFEIQVNMNDLKHFRKGCDALLLATIHPKHYALLENKTIEQSAIEAIDNGADAIVVTGDVTGKPPSIEKLGKVKNISGNIPIFIGSGLNSENANELLSIADGAIVGTAFKDNDFEKVIPEKVEKLMEILKLGEEHSGI